MPWIYLNSVTNEVLGIFRTEDEVDEASGETGTYDSKREDSVSTLGNADVGWHYDSTNAVYQIPPVFTTIQVVKRGVQFLHDALIDLSLYLESSDVRPYYPDDDRKIAHDMLALTHRAARGVMLSTNWTVTHKLTWLQRMALGPTDVPPEDPLQFFEVVEEARHTEEPILSPTEYFMWAHPNPGPTDDERWALADCVRLTGQEEDNFAEATTDYTIFKNGSWINDITI